MNSRVITNWNKLSSKGLFTSAKAAAMVLPHSSPEQAFYCILRATFLAWNAIPLWRLPMPSLMAFYFIVYGFYLIGI
jgi:hypothetical protein